MYGFFLWLYHDLRDTLYLLLVKFSQYFRSLFFFSRISKNLFIFRVPVNCPRKSFEIFVDPISITTTALKNRIRKPFSGIAMINDDNTLIIIVIIAKNIDKKKDIKTFTIRIDRLRNKDTKLASTGTRS